MPPQDPIPLDCHSEGLLMAEERRRAQEKQIKQSQRQVVRIDVLPDDALLEIFDFYVVPNEDEYDFLWTEDKGDVEEWQVLVHVCRRWRILVFASPGRLNLRLYLTPRTPGKHMNVWPTLPLTIRAKTDYSSGTDNIIAALGRSNSVRDVDLPGLGTRRLERVLAAMQVPFPELEGLQLSISSRDKTPPVIPDSFLGGSAPCLQALVLDGIPFPSVPNLPLSANHLVLLHLCDIPHSGYIPPRAMVTLLSALSSLTNLILEFRSPQSCPDLESRSLPPPERFILPALDQFDFKGVTEYLEEFVTCIDAPQLHNARITFFNQIDFDTPRLAQFIDRTPRFAASNKAYVEFDDETASLTLRPGRTHKFDLDAFHIDISCREPDWQLSSIGQVCNSVLPPLPVEDLRIGLQGRRVDWKDDAIEKILWLQFLRPFTAVKNLQLVRGFAPRIAVALQELVGIRITEVLPGLQNIFIEGLRRSGPLRDSIGQFVTARQLSGRPVAISDLSSYSDTRSTWM